MDGTGTSFEHKPMQVIAEKGVKNVPGRTRATTAHVNSVGERMSTMLVVNCKIERSVFCFKTAETKREM